MLEVEAQSAVTRVPAFRFPEYKGNWMATPLGRITSSVDYRGKAPEKSAEGVFLVTAKNIKQGYIDYETSKEYVPLHLYDAIMSKGLPEVGDVLITTEAPMGNVAQLDKKDVALAQRVIKFRAKEGLLNDYLMYYMLGSVFQKSIGEKAIGTTVQGISGKELHRSMISFPTLPEQTKIAGFLSAVDGKIQQLTRKKALLDQYKKGVMQQLFAQEIRFTRADGKAFPEWEEKLLGDLLWFKNGANAEKEQYGSGHKFINVLDILQNDYITSERIIGSVELPEAEFKKNEVVYGDILFQRSSETREDVGLSNVYLDKEHTAAFGGFVIRGRAKEEYHPQFMNFMLRSDKSRQDITSRSGGSTRYNIGQESLEAVSVSIPCLEEQQRIAGFLSALDGRVAAVQQQLAGAVRWKKGLLQQMFV